MINAKTKKTYGLIVLVLVVAIAVSLVCAVLIANAESSYGDAFDYSTSTFPVKYKAMQGDSDNPSKKGLKLYAYDSGAFVEFRAELNGTFASDTKAVKNGKSVDLTKYSLVFTDKATAKSFSVTVANKGSYNDVYVSVNGNNAGVYYYTSQYDINGTAYGYTALYNASGSYTSVASDEIALSFDPTTMQVSVLGNGGAYHLVWDFSEEYNDGRQLSHDLPKFGDYTVKIVLDEVKTNGKGELLVYSFGGYSFGSATAEGEPTISANVIANAIVGQAYSVPQAQAFDIFSGKLPDSDITVNVYDVQGNAVTVTDNAFTPASNGDYFICYSYRGITDKAASAMTMYRVTALDKDAISYKITLDDNSFDGGKTIGVQQSLRIPVATVSSNIIIGGSAEMQASLFKDGVAVANYQNVSGSFEYKFEQDGVYTVKYSTNAFGVEMVDTKTITASKDIPVYVLDEIPETVEYMSKLDINGGKVYKNGSEYDMIVSVKYPSGKMVGGGEITLDELGIYTVTYAYADQVREQTFVVKQKYSDMFGGEGVSTKYGTLQSNNTVKGQLITLTNNNAVVYNKVVDLSDNTFNEYLADKSQNTPLLEMYAQPHSLGITDVQGIYITLTDKYDANNYIIIRIKYLSYIPNNMRIRTMASGQSWVGYDYEFWTGAISVDAAQSHEDGGTIVSFDCSQSATSGNFTDRKLRLYFDNDTGRLYTRTWQDKAGNSAAENPIPIPWLVRDYKTSDTTLSAGDTPWKGFTTGEVYLSVYATGISDTANFIVTNIDGEDMSGEFYNDNVAPIISVDVGEDNVPQAKVGKKFNVFDMTATDAYSSVVSTDVKVLYGGNEVALANGAFVPDSVGNYTIVYTAVDSYGNVAKKTIEVEAKNSLSKLGIEIDGEIPENISFGQTINLPLATAYGGAGGSKIDVKVVAVDNGKTIDIVNNSFVCLEEGGYQIKYTVTDYIGEHLSKSIWIDVQFSTMPVFNEDDIVLPDAFMAGDEYFFDEYTAKYYNGKDSMELVKATISVTDADGERTITDGYIPKASNEVKFATIIFNFTANGESLTFTKTVPINTTKRGVGYLANFFDVTNARATAESDAVWFAPDSDKDLRFAFARAISRKYLNVSFKADKANPFTYATIYLRDTRTNSEKVKLTYRYRFGTLMLSVNDGAYVKANFNSDDMFAIKYDLSTGRILDVLGMEVGKLTTYVNGTEFDGFSSQFVYMECYSDGKIGICGIANQTFNSFVRDSISPLLTVEGSFSGTYLPGKEVVLPDASAYDVLGSVGDISVTVKSPSGEIVVEGLAKNKLSFVPQSYGSYSVVYSVSDSSGNTIPFTSEIVVVDNIAPTLTFNGEIPTTAKVGTSIKIPDYTVSDNGNLSKVVVKMYVCGPDGIMLTVKDNKVVFNRRGEYVVYYFVVDENNNTTNYAFTITAS